jgi:hypothetical protein
MQLNAIRLDMAIFEFHQKLIYLRQTRRDCTRQAFHLYPDIIPWQSKTVNRRMLVSLTWDKEGCS